MIRLIPLALALSAPTSEEPPPWGAFLGPEARGGLRAAELPLEWSLSPSEPPRGVAWRTELAGHGQSSPVVYGSTAYVTSVSGPQKDVYHVTAVDARSGRVRWSRAFESERKVKSSFYVSRAAPTPVVDARGVYAFFENGLVVALDHDGEPRWERDLVVDHGPLQNRFGLAASLCQHRDRVFVLVDHEGPSYLLALAKADGATIWKAERDSRVSWSSPVAARLFDRDRVLVSSAGSVDVYDADDGALRMSFDDLGGNTSNSPLLLDGDRLLIGASPGRGEGAASPATRSNLLLQLAPGEDGSIEPTVAWRAERVTSSFATPILHRGLAYFVNGTGVLNCVDGETGEKVFTERLGGPVWATPLAVEDRIYLFRRDGVTTVIAAGREFEKLAENRLWPEDAVDPSADQGPLPEGAVTEDEDGPPDPRERQPILYGYACHGGALLLRAGAVLYRVGSMQM